MPFKIMPLESETETVAATGRAMATEVKTLSPGQSVIGVIGKVREEPVVEPETLTAQEKERKAALVAFLAKYIVPPETSQIHPNPAVDRAVFLRKLKKQTLAELRRFWTKTIPEEPSEDVILSLNDKWHDLSP